MNATLLPVNARCVCRPFPFCVAAVLVTLSALCSGCVSSKFHAAKSGTPPPLELNLPSTPKQPLQAFVDTVIVYRGAGSWKRYAYWDEYVISLTNSCSAPTTLVSAMLVDAEGREVAPGTDWQRLETESVKWWETARLRQNIVLGASSLVVLSGAVVAPASVLVGWAALSGVTIGTGGAALIAAPFVAGAIASRNQESERTIRTEFDRRRLEIPQTMRGGSSLHGSLFFPITPGPRKLVLTYRHHSTLHTSTIDLARISDLHLKPAGVETTSSAPAIVAPVSAAETSR